MNTFVRDLFLASFVLKKAHVSFVVPRVLPMYAAYCWNCPFVLWCVRLSGPLPEMVKGMRYLPAMWGPAIRDILFALVARYVGMWLEPAMLCRPPLTSPRRGWMELPDVGDFCQVVIQKWMNHILTEIPLHPLYVWYDIQSFGEFVSVHTLDKIDMIATSRTTFELLYDMCTDMLWKASFPDYFAS